MSGNTFWCFFWLAVIWFRKSDQVVKKQRVMHWSVNVMSEACILMHLSVHVTSRSCNRKDRGFWRISIENERLSISTKWFSLKMNGFQSMIKRSWLKMQGCRFQTILKEIENNGDPPDPQVPNLRSGDRSFPNF